MFIYFNPRIAFKITYDLYQNGKEFVILEQFVCDDESNVSAFYVCDGREDCNGNEDEVLCHRFHYGNFSNYPIQLCSYILMANLSNFDMHCPIQSHIDREIKNVTCRSWHKYMDTLTFNLAESDDITLHKGKQTGQTIVFMNLTSVDFPLKTLMENI